MTYTYFKIQTIQILLTMDYKEEHLRWFAENKGRAMYVDLCFDTCRWWLPHKTPNNSFTCPCGYSYFQ